jgi:uncharacterized protein (DUF433 family)
LSKVIAAIGPDRDTPIYAIKDAARIVGMHPSTLRYWLQESPAHRALVEPADPYTPRLSFNNLAETHILQVTKGHNIPIARSRAALETLRERFTLSAHPLLEHGFFVVHGVRDLFVRELSGFSTVTNLSRGGQTALPEMLDLLIKRITCDEYGPIGLRPMSTDRVVVDLRISGGQPVVKGTGVLAVVIARRFKAGDSVRMIAEDYEIKPSDVKEVLTLYKVA